ncbi:hypothetical protein [Saccharothrix hoggarensis]|uniref:Holin n=1 Tax=Saccharothrix hoggarensis TaxID=913853 RepID=A0ABW3QDU4_9PSEU
MLKKLDLADLLDRVGWTFVQALGGIYTAKETSEQVGQADWRALLVGGLVSSLLVVLKVAGVKASHVASARAAVAKASEIPAVANLLASLAPVLGKLDDGKAGALVAEVLKKTLAELEAQDAPENRPASRH